MIILLFAVLVTALMVIARCLSWRYIKKIIDPNNPPVLHDIKIYKIWRNIGFLFNREDLAENDKLLNQVIRRLKNGVEK